MKMWLWVEKKEKKRGAMMSERERKEVVFF